MPEETAAERSLLQVRQWLASGICQTDAAPKRSARIVNTSSFQPQRQQAFPHATEVPLMPAEAFALLPAAGLTEDGGVKSARRNKSWP